MKQGYYCFLNELMKVFLKRFIFNLFLMEKCFKIIGKNGIVFTILRISLMCGLIEDSWIFISASAFNLLQYVVLVEIYEQNLASHR